MTANCRPTEDAAACLIDGPDYMRPEEQTSRPNWSRLEAARLAKTGETAEPTVNRTTVWRRRRRTAKARIAGQMMLDLQEQAGQLPLRILATGERMTPEAGPKVDRRRTRAFRPLPARYHAFGTAEDHETHAAAWIDYTEEMVGRWEAACKRNASRTAWIGPHAPLAARPCTYASETR